METSSFSATNEYQEIGIYLAQSNASKHLLTREQEFKEFTLLEEHYQDYQNSVLRTGQAAQGIKSTLETLLTTSIGSRQKQKIFASQTYQFFTHKQREITPLLLKRKTTKIENLLSAFINSDTEQDAQETSDLLFEQLYDLNLKRQFMIYSVPQMIKTPFFNKTEPWQIIENENTQQAIESYENYIQQRNKIAEKNLRLVTKLAKKYGSYKSIIRDLIQEGNKGLIKAIEEFDLNKGTKFSTYATWWIRQSINRSLNNNEIRLPSHVLTTLEKIKQRRNSLTQQLQREPTHEELFDSLNGEIKNLRYYISIKRILSLNHDSGDGYTLLDDLKDEQEPHSGNPEIKTEIHKLLSRLGPIDRDIIIKRYGLDGNESMTLGDIGKIYGLTRERIRQREQRALDQLKGNSLILENLL